MNQDKTYIEFTDDFMFCEVMSRHQELCRELLERILGRPVSFAENNEQKVFRVSKDKKSIRTDIYLEGETEAYDIEMQVERNRDISKRVRYYQSAMDLDLLSKGQPYGRLKRSYIIFISPNVLFGRGLYVYTFKNLCLEDPALELGDETTKIFLCAKGDRMSAVSKPIAGFLRYVGSGIVEDDFTAKIKTAVDMINADSDWREQHMLFTQVVEMNREEGKIIGRIQGMIDDEKSKDEILDFIIKKYRITQADAEKYYEEALAE